MLPASHAADMRFASSNTAVAKVTKNGKIKAVAKGECTIYIYAKNGNTKAVTVIVTD